MTDLTELMPANSWEYRTPGDDGLLRASEPVDLTNVDLVRYWYDKDEGRLKPGTLGDGTALALAYDWPADVWILASGWHDYTGWDCRSGVEVVTARSLQALLPFATDEARRVLDLGGLA